METKENIRKEIEKQVRAGIEAFNKSERSGYKVTLVEKNGIKIEPCPPCGDSVSDRLAKLEKEYIEERDCMHRNIAWLNKQIRQLEYGLASVLDED